MDCSASIIVTALRILGRKHIEVWSVYENFGDIFGYTVDMAWTLNEMGIGNFVLRSIDFNRASEYYEKFRYYF